MSPDITASVRALLLNQAHRSGEEFERTLVRFAAAAALRTVDRGMLQDHR